MCYHLKTPKNFLFDFISFCWREHSEEFLVTHNFTQKSLNNKITYLERFLQITIQKLIFLANLKKYLCRYSREFEENYMFNDFDKLDEVIFIDCYDEAFFQWMSHFFEFSNFFYDLKTFFCIKLKIKIFYKKQTFFKIFDKIKTIKYYY